jgi:hypothetical protein
MNRKVCLLLLTLIVGLCIAFVPGVPTAHAAAGSSILNPGETLYLGEELRSTDKLFTLAFQTDGNFVLYSEYGGHHSTWQANTETKGAARVTMQGDGNLVVYSYRGTPLWTSGTNGHNGAYLAVQTDGNAVVYNANGAWSGWATKTSIMIAQAQFVGGNQVFTLSAKLYGGLATETVTGGYAWDGVRAWQWGAINHSFDGPGTSTLTDKGSWYDPTRNNDFNIYVNSTDMLPNPTAFGINSGPIQTDTFFRLWVRPDGSTYSYVGH